MNNEKHNAASNSDTNHIYIIIRGMLHFMCVYLQYAKYAAMFSNMQS